MKTQTTAHEVAEYLLWLASQADEESREWLSPLRLQKLLYMAQGWALTEWEQPIFSDDIEVWEKGPVVNSVYQTWRGMHKPITEVPQTEPKGLTAQEKGLVNQVWRCYRKYSASGLADETHRDPAVQQRRGKAQNAKLPLEEMAKDFSAKIPALVARLTERFDSLRDHATPNTVKLSGRQAL